MSTASIPEAPHPAGTPPPIALDGLAWGIEFLDAILVVSLADAHLHAVWTHPDAGLRPEELAGTLRDAYRVGQFASRRLSALAAPAPDRRAELASPVLTLELPKRIAILRRIRGYVVACAFDPSMPLGLARLVASRLSTELDPELPLAIDPVAHVPEPPILHRAPLHTPTEEPPATLTFGAVRPRRTLAPPRPSTGEIDHIRRLIAALETRAPEPHTARLRLALRAGLTRVALDHPETLGPEALVLIESAVEEILGLDRAELARIA
jgi:hypothetical protein